MTEALNTVARSIERATSPIQGAGVGLRTAHIDEILQTCPEVPWFEILADNHTARGGLVPAQLTAVRENYPLTFHCVGMSLAGSDPLDWDYLAMIKHMATTYEPAWLSDHLCFTRFGEHHYHDLLPVPYTAQSLAHVSRRIEQIQDFLGRRLLVENVSSYLEFTASEMDEADFLAALLHDTDCDLLLDINNIYVSACNHGFDPIDYLERLPLARVREIHLAGYDDRGDYLLDAHNNPVAAPVWTLYAHVIQKIPGTPTLIEWDNDLPALSVLLGEAQRADAVGAAPRRRRATI